MKDFENKAMHFFQRHTYAQSHRLSLASAMRKIHQETAAETIRRLEALPPPPSVAVYDDSDSPFLRNEANKELNSETFRQSVQSFLTEKLLMKRQGAGKEDDSLAILDSTMLGKMDYLQYAKWSVLNRPHHTDPPPQEEQKEAVVSSKLKIQHRRRVYAPLATSVTNFLSETLLPNKQKLVQEDGRLFRECVERVERQKEKVQQLNRVLAGRGPPQPNDSPSRGSFRHPMRQGKKSKKKSGKQKQFAKRN
ncbi:hypothetical protein AGDE_17163 [Angomonas deanei]|uniref:Uncharacterized protein n=1 Tax=Angomonas deanei TaxID=59799 RepID=A0A7G2C3S0_9TRYP|nr:hypothetical protein AGDE_17163 [Angomonas deanei]CAD2214356.1 hypothetical protein, conserved [Angomonas deanei]|eukprot:EPY15129.1 hypothetical protein AGDE_17163 [Angomonas deanei]